MQANELRIWNWVSCNGDYYRISTVAIGQPFLDTIKFGVGVLNWSDIHPIALTEEILLKAGFLTKQFYDGLFTFYIKKFEIQSDGELIIYNDLSEGVELKYVHQLQNLYFAITGEELQINL